MASTPSFAELVVVVFGVIMFVSWVVSDVLEEQLLGQTRRDRQRAVRQRAVRRQLPVPRAALPRAHVRRAS
ncbi:MAG: hypothetical protein IPQ07_34465 [Myxococcales bacterium]|nr:hypothetical protein [Myxococcales bacterium]